MHALLREEMRTILMLLGVPSVRALDRTLCRPPEDHRELCGQGRGGSARAAGLAIGTASVPVPARKDERDIRYGRSQMGRSDTQMFGT